MPPLGFRITLLAMAAVTSGIALRDLIRGLDGQFIGRLGMATTKDRGRGPAQRTHRLRMLVFAGGGFFLAGMMTGLALYGTFR
jgi:hypothetical protein